MKKMSLLFQRDRFQAVVFLIPGVLILLLLSVYPLIYSLGLSFSEWNVRDPNSVWTFVGINNYINIIKDKSFISSCYITFKFILVSLLLEISLGLAIAFLVTNIKIKRAVVNIFRSLLVMTIVVIPTVTGILWKTILQDRYGPLNYLLSFLKIPGIAWLSKANTAFIAIILVEVWQQTTVSALIFIGGLLGIQKYYVEAAHIDGCSHFGVFRYVILPLMKPIFAIVLLLRSMDLLKVFDFIYAMTYGGPGNSTEVANLYIYKLGMKFLNFNEAASASWVLLIILMPLTLYLILKVFLPSTD